MKFNFKIQKDKLIAGSVLLGNSGNVGTYTCNFDIADNRDFLWLCVFKKDNTAYQQVIEDGSCVIPAEVLEGSGTFQIGCYATDENMRISTNWLEFCVKDGAYSESTSPKEPAPDVWEELVMKTLPYIGETGNWYVYDKEAKTYVDSGVSSRGEKGDTGNAGQDGYTPQRGIDYWTQEDRNAIKAEVEEDLNFEERLATTVGEFGNSLKGMDSGTAVCMADVSSLEHIMDVKVRSKNLWKPMATQTINGVTLAVDEDGVCTLNGNCSESFAFSYKATISKGTYTLTDNAQGTFPQTDTARTQVYVAENGYDLAILNNSELDSSVTGTLSDDSEAEFIIRCEGGFNYDNCVIKPQLEDGETPTTYMPYVNVNDTRIKKYGANLLDIKATPMYYTSGCDEIYSWEKTKTGFKVEALTTAGTPARIALYIGTLDELKGKTITVSATQIGSMLSIIQLQGTNIYSAGVGNVKLSAFENIKTVQNNVATFVVPEKATYKYLIVSFRVDSGAVNTIGEVKEWNNIQVQVGDKATEYEAYKEPITYTVGEDGCGDGITSMYPSTSLLPDSSGVTVTCGYNRDINKAFGELVNAVISLGGNV